MMKSRIILTVVLSFFAVRVVFAQSVEGKIRAAAVAEYPNDPKMQQFVYDKQMAAYRYMTNVTDQDVKNIALAEYPEDYSMQKFTYEMSYSPKLGQTAKV